MTTQSGKSENDSVGTPSLDQSAFRAYHFAVLFGLLRGEQPIHGMLLLRRAALCAGVAYASISDEAVLRWAVNAAAAYMIEVRMRTPLGDAASTLEALDKMIVEQARQVTSETYVPIVLSVELLNSYVLLRDCEQTDVRTVLGQPL